ncbi:class I SAM-dependent methyltransferase [Nocardioides jensenii]|uniref:class I SAM-dependent methyltransferase n=1 Tax=Nocardioides jensenii TaxID=1843 RepID=UPI00083405F8|nr:class I SAM-dependent methyltransferase [Nocardioides jensenii]
MSSDPDADARRLAAAAGEGDDPNRWFEDLYAAAQRGEAVVPWDRGAAHPLLEWWAGDRLGAQQLPEQSRAMVVGSGPGHDARLLDDLGFVTTAFDISPTAVANAAAALADTSVDVRRADLLDLPGEWRGGFDLVLEAMTVQAMPRSLRQAGTAAVRSMVAPGGVLLVIGMLMPDDGDLDDGPPWLLTRDEIDAFARDGIEFVTYHDEPATDGELVRYLAEFRRG